MQDSVIYLALLCRGKFLSYSQTFTKENQEKIQKLSKLSAPKVWPICSMDAYTYRSSFNRYYDRCYDRGSVKLRAVPKPSDSAVIDSLSIAF